MGWGRYGYTSEGYTPAWIYVLGAVVGFSLFVLIGALAACAPSPEPQTIRPDFDRCGEPYGAQTDYEFYHDDFPNGPPPGCPDVPVWFPPSNGKDDA